jgi:hypothetical protein
MWDVCASGRLWSWSWSCSVISVDRLAGGPVTPINGFGVVLSAISANGRDDHSTLVGCSRSSDVARCCQLCTRHVVVLPR